MQNVLKVEGNPNRENIFYEVHPRGNRGDEKLNKIIEPLALELKEKLLAMPLTIVYRFLKLVVNAIATLNRSLVHISFIQLSLLQFLAIDFLHYTMPSTVKSTVIVYLKILCQELPLHEYYL